MAASPSAVILELQKIKSDTVSPSISHEVMGPDAMQDLGSISGLGKPLGGGHGNPFWYSCLENGKKSIASKIGREFFPCDKSN